ncbi:MAG: HlyD family secretion protein, partial [Planctomycetota bacterium]
MNARRTLAALLPAAALSAVVLLSLGASPARDGPVTSVVKRPVTIQLVEYGDVTAKEVQSVLAPITGEVIWVIREGTAIKPGDPVLRMNTADYESRLEEDRRAGVGLEGRLKTRQKVAEALALQRAGAVRKAEIDLEVAKQRLAEAGARPVLLARRKAELDLEAARLRADRARVNEKALETLASSGYSSEAKAKQARLARVRTEADLARALAIHREVLAGTPPETLRALRVGVRKAEMALTQAKFNAEADVAGAREEIAVAQMRLDVYEERLNRIRDDIESATAAAPIDGVVALVDVWKGGSDLSPVQVGENHRRGREMLKVADVSALRVKIYVNECDIVRVRKGQKARVRLVAHPGVIYPAEVADVAVFADDKNRQLGSLAMEKSGAAGVNVVRV